MVKVERTFPAPASLEIESKKASGKYDKPDVIKQLRENFKDKCYICEIKDLQNPEVEHLLPHENGKYPERKFDLANVTTGAIYFFFRNKEEFFRAILDETAIEWKRRLQEYSESEINGSKTSAENDRELVSFLFGHKEEVRILFEKSEGTIYESYKEELCEILENAFMEFYRRLGGKEEDSGFAGMMKQYKGMLESSVR